MRSAAFQGGGHDGTQRRDQASPQPRLEAQPPNTKPAGADLSPRDLVKSRIRIAESSNNDRAANRKSTARGRYQFIDSTWKSLHRRFYGTDGLDDRFNPEKQELFMNVLMDENEAALRKAKFEVTAPNLYLAHFAGWPDAIKLLRNPAASAEALLGKDAIRANKEVLQGKTASEVIAWADRKMNGGPPRAQPSRSRARAPVPRK